MNLLIGLLAYIGDYRLGLQPGDQVSHKSTKRRSLPEEYVVLSYDSRSSFGDSVIVTPKNSLDGNIEVESAKVAAISQGTESNMKCRSKNVQNFMYEKSSELFQLLGRILTVEGKDETIQSPLTLTVGMLRNLAISAADAVVESVKIINHKKDGTVNQSLLEFTRKIRPTLIRDFISNTGPNISCDTAIGVLEALRNGHFGYLLEADSSTLHTVVSAGMRTENLNKEFVKLGEAINDAQVATFCGTDSTHVKNLSPSVANALIGTVSSSYLSDVLDVKTNSSQIIATTEGQWVFNSTDHSGIRQEADFELSSTITNPIEAVVQSLARVTVSKVSSMLRITSEMENWSNATDSPPLLGQLYVLLKMSSLGNPQLPMPLVAAPIFVPPDEIFAVVKICNFIFARVFSDTIEETAGNNWLANIGTPSLSMALALTSVFLTQTAEQDRVDEGMLCLH